MNGTVREYEVLRSQYKEAQAEINELKFSKKEIEMTMFELKDQLMAKVKDYNDLKQKYHNIEQDLKA